MVAGSNLKPQNYPGGLVDVGIAGSNQDQAQRIRLFSETQNVMLQAKG